jgi:hypothetical protein
LLLAFIVPGLGGLVATAFNSFPVAARYVKTLGELPPGKLSILSQLLLGYPWGISRDKPGNFQFFPSCFPGTAKTYLVDTLASLVLSILSQLLLRTGSRSTLRCRSC